MMNTVRTLIKSLHFWALIAIMLFILILYQAWPWRELNFAHGVWQWVPWQTSLDDLAIFELKHHFTGILFMLPIIYATVVYKWQGALVVSLVSLLYSMLEVGLWASVDAIVTNSLLLLSPAAIIAAINIEMELRRRDRRVLAEREQQRKLYLSKMYVAEENERRRLAQELHDDTMQTFLLMAKRARSLLARRGDAKEAGRIAEYIRDTALQAVEDLRRICLDLRPSILDNLGLVPSLRWLADHLHEESGIDTQIIVNYTNHTQSKLSSQAEATTFRIVQEGLNNVKRHSKAKKAILALEFAEDCLTLKIRDDGQGFIVSNNFTDLLAEGKLGLIGMQERIESLGGYLEINSKPSGGTLLSIVIPY